MTPARAQRDSAWSGMSRAMALLVGSWLVAACVSAPQVSPSSVPLEPSVAASPLEPWMDLPAPARTAIPSPSSAPAADVIVSPAIPVVYAEQEASVMTSAFIAGGKTGPHGPLAVATATIDFGDGSQDKVSQACESPAERIPVRHVFHATGDLTLSVVAATLCQPGWQLTLDSGDGIRVLPAAGPGTADWPRCTTYQLRFTDGGTGAGLGNVRTLVHIRNVSSSGCNLEGYPDLRLISSNGALLPTHVEQATDGAYMFPAMAVGRVALAPQEGASFEFAYTDNPGGDAMNEPYDVACPPATWLRVILPGTHEYGTGKVASAPCEGFVGVSPIYPGSGPIDFP